MTARLERIDVVCTGGRYDDPEHGPTPRHARQKLGRLYQQRAGHVGKLYDRGKPFKCPQCERTVPVAMSASAWGSFPPSSEEYERNPSGYSGGVWQRIADWLEGEHPDRRVAEVDISDLRYPW